MRSARPKKPSQHGIPEDSEQQAALVSIDPRNGYIKAMVGGRDYKTNQYQPRVRQDAPAGLVLQADSVFDGAASRVDDAGIAVQERADGLHLR